MKYHPLIYILIVCLAHMAFNSCEKEPDFTRSSFSPISSNSDTGMNIQVACDNRQVIKARLVPFGKLSQSRMYVRSAAAGTKILFAAGWTPNAQSSRVDIYDTVTRSWSIAELSEEKRDGMAVASLGNKIFFAGGGDFDWIDVSSRVDIYDAGTDKWSTAELSIPRSNIIGVTAGNKVLFAGGGDWTNPYYYGTPVVDIYDNSTDSWSTASLSMYRYEMGATNIGNRVYFAGGSKTIFEISDRIDIYDAMNNTWTESKLAEARSGISGYGTADEIFWAGGGLAPYMQGYKLSDHMEIRNINTGSTTFACMLPRRGIDIVRKNEYLVFFTGSLLDTKESGYQFEIYNTNTKTWYNGLLDKKIADATVISVNNRILVAGGRDNWNRKYFDEVWELEF